MREVIARCVGSRVKFAFTAPTNKAAKELRRVTGEARTIFSLLGLRIDKSGELKQIVAGKTLTDLSEYDAIFIDEGSMVNRNLMDILEGKAIAYGVKIVFMGDRAQLPPVGEDESPVWKLPIGASLTTVMRHDNQILTMVTAIREVMYSFAPSIIIKSDNAHDEGVWKMEKKDFVISIHNAALAGGFADGTNSKVIAWRNAQVDKYNTIIRHGIFGDAAVPGFYLLGERIVAAGPCLRGEDVLMSTDDEALVERITPCIHPKDSRYTAIELHVRTELNRLVRLIVCHPHSAADFASDLAAMATAAKANSRLWPKFWKHKELFHDIKYAYALTTHRSQGSTYTNVWVDSHDILMNRNRKEAFQCFYVACSRPTTRLRIV